MAWNACCVVEDQRPRRQRGTAGPATDGREAAREEERRHIARELHDEMGQYLSALRMEVSVLRMRWDGLDHALQEKTTGLQRMVDKGFCRDKPELVA